MSNKETVKVKLGILGCKITGENDWAVTFESRSGLRGLYNIHKGQRVVNSKFIMHPIITSGFIAFQLEVDENFESYVAVFIKNGKLNISDLATLYADRTDIGDNIGYTYDAGYHHMDLSTGETVCKVQVFNSDGKILDIMVVGHKYYEKPDLKLDGNRIIIFNKHIRINGVDYKNVLQDHTVINSNLEIENEVEFKFPLESYTDEEEDEWEA